MSSAQAACAREPGNGPASEPDNGPTSEPDTGSASEPDTGSASEPEIAIAEFDYHLPREAIAQTPIEPRDAARLLVDKGAAVAPEHRHIRDLPELLLPGDLLVANNTKVIPARLKLRKRSGGSAEVLLLGPLDQSRAQPSGQPSSQPSDQSHAQPSGWWSALVKPSRRLRPGTELVSETDAAVRVMIGERIVDATTGLDDGQRAVQVSCESERGNEIVVSPSDAVRLLGVAGEAPLPPYISGTTAADTAAGTTAVGTTAVGTTAVGTAAADTAARRASNLERYQTIYADQPGSVAAPTAGLHFTPALLDALANKNIGWATVDLVVGLDTFRPVSGELSEHVMHTERYHVPANTWQQCQSAKRVVAVGTTTVRALESAARGELTGRTDLFLKRGAQFQVVDALLTNFHLPLSTLLVLVEAFIGPRWRNLYEDALTQGYRFLSFGDAMLLQRSAPEDVVR